MAWKFFANKHSKVVEGWDETVDVDRERLAILEGQAADPDLPWEDITSVFGGDSSFVHLVEDTDNNVVIADETFVMFSTTSGKSIQARKVSGPGWTDDLLAYAALSADGKIASQLEDASLTANFKAYSVGGYNEDDLRFAIGGDGSLHWGDGTNPPDVSLERTLYGGNPALATFHSINAVNVLDGSDCQAALGEDGSLYLQRNMGVEYVQLTPHTVGNGSLALGGAGAAEGRGLALMSPDGLITKILTIDNAGAIALL